MIKTSSGDVVVLETPLGLHAASQQEDRGVVCVTLEDSESSKDSNLKHGKGQCDHVEPIAPEHAVEDGTGERTRREGPKSQLHTVCTMYVDIDDHFYNRWKGTCSTGGDEADPLCAQELQQNALMRATFIMQEAAGVFDDNFGNHTINFQVCSPACLFSLCAKPCVCRPVPPRAQGN